MQARHLKIALKNLILTPRQALGPVGLYYFFSPDDQTALKDVRVLNKIFQEGKLGVVGIPVRGKDEEIIQFLNEAKPLFPVRRSDAEVRMIKPSVTPELHWLFRWKRRFFVWGQSSVKRQSPWASKTSWSHKPDSDRPQTKIGTPKRLRLCPGSYFLRNVHLVCLTADLTGKVNYVRLRVSRVHSHEK